MCSLCIVCVCVLNKVGEGCPLSLSCLQSLSGWALHLLLSKAGRIFFHAAYLIIYLLIYDNIHK